LQGDRRKFNRKPMDARREALIAAALGLVAEGGAAAATVRAIAERAGVTPGLIRHYFITKEALLRAAYVAMMQGMAADSLDVVATAPDRPAARLAMFVAASLRPPVVDPQAMGLWAGFIHQMQRDADMKAAHQDGYLHYRDLLQGLIAALPGRGDAAQLRRDAIACNAVIDGLWLEGSALPDAFAPDELVQIGLHAVGAILKLDLAADMPEKG
jgi:TetR/AcrR family transcriptional repressor of bet genes